MNLKLEPRFCNVDGLRIRYAESDPVDGDLR
jgi:hypothetical protein